MPLREAMGRPLRLFEPEGIYFVTGRTLQGRLLMTPTREIVAIIGGVLARAMAAFDIDVFAFVFTSNHFHMLLRSTTGHIPAFMQYLRGNIAKKVGQTVDWSGKFWDRRYDAEPVLDDEALIGRLRYIIAHGVKEGLVTSCADWPGLSSLPELQAKQPRSFAWPKPVRDGEEEHLYPINLAVLPCWEHLTLSERAVLIMTMIAEVERKAVDNRRGAPALGATAVLAHHPHDRPKSLERSPRPLCHASTPSGRAAYAAKYREYVAAYREASLLYRAGQLDVDFPPYSYRPPWAPIVQRLAS